MIDVKRIVKQIARITALKEKLQGLNDVELAEHLCEHHLLAGSMETAKEFAALSNRLGFSNTEPFRVELDAAPGESWYAFDVTSRRDTRMPSLLNESLMLYMLADAFGVIYNGSGVMAVPPQSPAVRRPD